MFKRFFASLWSLISGPFKRETKPGLGNGLDALEMLVVELKRDGRIDETAQGPGMAIRLPDQRWVHYRTYERSGECISVDKCQGLLVFGIYYRDGSPTILTFLNGSEYDARKEELSFHQREQLVVFRRGVLEVIANLTKKPEPVKT